MPDADVDGFNRVGIFHRSAENVKVEAAETAALPAGCWLDSDMRISFALNYSDWIDSEPVILDSIGISMKSTSNPSPFRQHRWEEGGERGRAVRPIQLDFTTELNLIELNSIQIETSWIFPPYKTKPQFQKWK